jgi:hypothetical protein
MQKGSGIALAHFAIAIFLCSISVTAVDALDGPALGTPLQRRSGFDFYESSCIGIMMKKNASTNTITDVAVPCCASNEIPHPSHVTTPNDRANSRKSMHFVHQTTPEVIQATSPVVARRTARWLHDLTVTAAPFCHSYAATNSSNAGCHLDPKCFIHCRGSARANCAVASHVRLSNGRSEVHSMSLSVLEGASDMLRPGFASPAAMIWYDCLVLCIIMKQAAPVVSIATLSGPRTTDNLMIRQKKWKSLCVVFHHNSRPSPAPLPRLEVNPLAFDSDFEFILDPSSSALMSIRSLMLPHFAHLAVNQVCCKWFTKVIVRPTKSSHFLVLPSAETGTADVMNNRVSQSFMETPIPFLFKSPVIACRYAACLVFRHPTSCIKLEAQNLSLVELLTVSWCLMMATLLGFCASLCCYGRLTFIMCQHLFVYQQLPIKCCAFLRDLVAFNFTIMILVFHLLIHPITNAQPCEQMMLGMKRSHLASATLPTGLMFFAGGWVGASSWRARLCDVTHAVLWCSWCMAGGLALLHDANDVACISKRLKVTQHACQAATTLRTLTCTTRRATAGPRIPQVSDKLGVT